MSGNRVHTSGKDMEEGGYGVTEEVGVKTSNTAHICIMTNTQHTLTEFSTIRNVCKPAANTCAHTGKTHTHSHMDTGAERSLLT